MASLFHVHFFIVSGRQSLVKYRDRIVGPGLSSDVHDLGRTARAKLAFRCLENMKSGKTVMYFSEIFISDKIKGAISVPIRNSCSEGTALHSLVSKN